MSPIQSNTPQQTQPTPPEQNPEIETKSSSLWKYVGYALLIAVAVAAVVAGSMISVTVAGTTVPLILPIGLGLIAATALTLTAYAFLHHPLQTLAVVAAVAFLCCL